MSKLIATLLAGVFAVATVTPVIAADAKADKMEAKTDAPKGDAKKADAKKADAKKGDAKKSDDKAADKK